jgi:hypothetical protein
VEWEEGLRYGRDAHNVTITITELNSLARRFHHRMRQEWTGVGPAEDVDLTTVHHINGVLLRLRARFLGLK